MGLKLCVIIPYGVMSMYIENTLWVALYCVYMQDSNPRTEFRDALLANLSGNVDSHDVMDAVESLSVDSTRQAMIHGPGLMAGFDDYNSL